MALSATPKADGTGVTKGTAYAVLGFTSSTVIVLDDDKKLRHVPYAALNDEERWSLDGGEKKSAPAPAPVALAPTASATPAVSQVETAAKTTT